MDTLRCRRVPADPLGGRVQDRQMLGMLGHELAPEGERVLACRMREFVHEAFDVDGVLVEIDAAPETRRHRRIAHRMVDQEIVDRITERTFGPGGEEALKDNGVLAVLQARGQDPRQDGLARYAHVERRQVAVIVQSAGELALRRRMIGAVQHILFARPDELDRRARQRLGDQHRLAGVIIAAAPAEAAAEMELMDFTLLRREARGLRRRGESPSPFCVGTHTSQRSGV